MISVFGCFLALRMPVTLVLKVSVPSDLSIEQFKEKLEKRLEILKSERMSSFQVQTCVYQPNAQQSPVVINQFLHSEYPATCFSILEPIQQNDYKVLCSDIGFASIQRRINELGVLVERKQSNMECTGSAIKVGDFVIKICSVTHSGSNRGLIVEITYTCGNTTHDSFGIMSEQVLSTFAFNLTEKSDMLANYVKRKHPMSPYFPEDTILQYFEHFNALRNTNLLHK
jgi:hypothetical protein